jgi:hypothetical protein
MKEAVELYRVAGSCFGCVYRAILSTDSGAR